MPDLPCDFASQAVCFKMEKKVFMKSLLLAPLIFLSAHAHSQCKLPQGEKITIGCTYKKCDFFTRSRLKAAGVRLGYKVKIINLSETRNVDQALASVDAVIVPGGADIHPNFYVNEVTPELKAYTLNNLHLAKLTSEGKARDDYEYSLVKRVINSPVEYKKLPVLGVCRGMQMLTVAQGIPLYLDIKTELGIPNRINKFDRINITDEPSLMSSLYGTKKFRGLELHHQGLRVDYYNTHKNEFPNVLVSSYSNNGLVAESIEYKDMTVLGVQYHPEKSLPKATYPVYKWLLTKSCEYKNSLKESL